MPQNPGGTAFPAMFNPCWLLLSPTFEFQLGVSTRIPEDKGLRILGFGFKGSGWRFSDQG